MSKIEHLSDHLAKSESKDAVRGDLDPAQRVTALCIEHERFSENFVREFGKIGAALASAVSDHAAAKKRLTALGGEHAEAQKQLSAVMARNEGLKNENSHLTGQAAAANARVERLHAELAMTREQLNAAQIRNESLSADLARVHEELDARRKDLVIARHELTDLTQKYGQARVEADQARIREATVETRLRMAVVDAEGDREGLSRAERISAEQNERILALTNELQSVRDLVRATQEERDSIIVEKDRFVADNNALKLRLDETCRKLDARIDGLSRTKTFLWDTGEKQRQQIGDQLSRIAQLEQSNAKLAKLLGQHSEAEEAQVDERNDAVGVERANVVRISG